MTHFHDVIGELRQPTRELRQAIPDAWAGFGALHEKSLAAGTVPAHLKELVALAIAVVKQCDGCIAYHARGAAAKGATREELAEVLAVALLMDGGPVSVYGPRAWAAFDEFAPPVAPAAGA
jgi:AhpD family alkylhydroperoxidase